MLMKPAKVFVFTEEHPPEADLICTAIISAPVG
jgi:hypothetical protein